MRSLIFFLFLLTPTIYYAQEVDYFQPRNLQWALDEATHQGKMLCYHNISFGGAGSEPLDLKILTDTAIVGFLNKHFVNVRTVRNTEDDALYPDELIRAMSTSFIFVDSDGEYFHQFGIYDSAWNAKPSAQILEELERIVKRDGVFAADLEAKIKAGDIRYETLSQFVDFVDGSHEIIRRRISWYIESREYYERFKPEFFEIGEWVRYENEMLRYFVIENQDTLKTLWDADWLDYWLWDYRAMEARRMAFAGQYDKDRLQSICDTHFEKFWAEIEFDRLAAQYWKDVNNKEFWPVFKPKFIRQFNDSNLRYNEAKDLCWQGYWTSKIIGDSTGYQDLHPVAQQLNQLYPNDAFILNMLAHFQYDLGMINQAIETQVTGLLAADEQAWDPAFIKYMRDELDLFEKGKPIKPNMNL